MDEDRDPTDFGVSRVLALGEREEIAAAEAARKRARRAAEAAPYVGPPASERVIERAYAAAGFSRAGRAERLLRRCSACGASPRSWCRGRMGYLHSDRGTPAD